MKPAKYSMRVHIAQGQRRGIWDSNSLNRTAGILFWIAEGAEEEEGTEDGSGFFTTEGAEAGKEWAFRF